MIVLDYFICGRVMGPLNLLADIINIDFWKESRSKIKLSVENLQQHPRHNNAYSKNRRLAGLHSL